MNSPKSPSCEGPIKHLAILGRGIAGLTAAYHLSKAGFKPVIYGRKQTGAQASRAAQGVLCNKGLIFFESPLFKAKLESLRSMPAFLDRIESESGLPIPRIFQGVNEPFWTEDDFQKNVSRIYRGKFWGVHRTQIQTPPKSANNPLGYIHYPDDGWFDPRAFLDALEHILKREGILFIEEDVETFQTIDTKIEINKQSFDQIILAAGAGSANLWPELDCKALRMFLIGGQTLECERQMVGDEAIQVKGNQSIAILKDKVIMGSTSWPGFESADIKADADQLRDAIQTNFGQTFTGGLSRSGTRMRFKDRMPLVGWLNTGKHAGKIYFLTGFYKNGMHLAEICAREMLFDITNKGDKRSYPEFSALRFSV